MGRDGEVGLGTAPGGPPGAGISEPVPPGAQAPFPEGVPAPKQRWAAGCRAWGGFCRVFVKRFRSSPGAGRLCQCSAAAPGFDPAFPRGSPRVPLASPGTGCALSGWVSPARNSLAVFLAFPILVGTDSLGLELAESRFTDPTRPADAGDACDPCGCCQPVTCPSGVAVAFSAQSCSVGQADGAGLPSLCSWPQLCALGLESRHRMLAACHTAPWRPPGGMGDFRLPASLGGAVCLPHHFSHPQLSELPAALHAAFPTTLRLW